MKKTVLILLLAVLSICAFSQKGNLTVGAKGGYVISSSDISYNGLLYGVDIAYHLSNPLEIALSGLFNPNISRVSKNDSRENKENLAVYSANLDFRFYFINQSLWATGPALGGQYYFVNNKTADLGADKTLGFNIGWHLRLNLTDNVKLNGGWRYTNAKYSKKSPGGFNDTFDMSHHIIYLGIGYTFELK